ncbi:MAG: serine--tRNA ligase, partial [Bacteroidota bacterium]
MITLQRIRDNKNEIIELLKKKHFDAHIVIDTILQLDDSRKLIQQQLNAKQAELNALSKEIGELFKQKKTKEAQFAKEKTAVLKQEIKELETSFSTCETDLQKNIVTIPNVPHPSVPEGRSDTDNVEVSSCGSLPQLKQRKPHWDLAEQYNLIDFELGNKL